MNIISSVIRLFCLWFTFVLVQRVAATIALGATLNETMIASLGLVLFYFSILILVWVYSHNIALVITNNKEMEIIYGMNNKNIIVAFSSLTGFLLFGFSFVGDFCEYLSRVIMVLSSKQFDVLQNISFNILAIVAVLKFFISYFFIFKGNLIAGHITKNT